MPSNKKMKGGRKKKTNNNQTKTHKSLNSHQDNTADMRKLRLAQANFEVQRMLGRPIKKYNLLYSTNEGDMFSSEDDLKEGFILEVLRKKAIEHPQGCQNWNLWYMLKSKDLDDDKQFFMYANLGDTITRRGISHDKYEYWTWKELKQ